MSDIQKQAWRDFNGFIKHVDEAVSQAAHVHKLITHVEQSKAEILDDPPRKAALKKLVDLHPDYDLTTIVTKITKLSTLKTWLEDNGFIGQ